MDGVMIGDMDVDGERRGFCARVRNGFSKMHGRRHGAMSRLPLLELLLFFTHCILLT